MSNKDYQLDASINLVGQGCPMNLVYTKVELKKLVSGQVLEIILDDGVPVRNVSRSIQEEGHELLHKNNSRMATGLWLFAKVDLVFLESHKSANALFDWWVS